MIRFSNVLVLTNTFSSDWFEVFVRICSCLNEHGATLYCQKSVLTEYQVLDHQRKGLETTLDHSNEKSSEIDHTSGDIVVNETLGVDFCKINPFWMEEKSIIDLIIAIGGDGTLLTGTKLYYDSEVPPILSFNFGSLGYLCPFQANDVDDVLDSLIKNQQIEWKSTLERLGIHILERDRLSVRLTKGTLDTFEISAPIFDFSTETVSSGKVLNCLNEIRIDSGKISQSVKIEIWLNRELLTIYEGYGIVLSTPTGSTWYNISLDGCIVHNGVDCIWLMAINPLSMSFRPIIVPKNTKFTLKISGDAGIASYRVSIDGGFIFNFEQDDTIEITGSEHPARFLAPKNEDDVPQWIEKLKTKILMTHNSVID